MLVVSAVDKTQRGSSEADTCSVSVAVCHCHQDLLDVVDINVPVLMKDFVGRSTVRMNCLEGLEYYFRGMRNYMQQVFTTLHGMQTRSSDEKAVH